MVRSRAGQYDAASAEERPQHLEALAAHHKQIQVWAENCPENFANRVALVAAEIACLEGRAVDAMRFYEQAVQSARGHGFVQNEGLAHELAARFYLARGLEKIARVYLRDARYCYLQWGAGGKVRQLEELYPHLCDEPVPATATTTTPVEQLDVATVVKASQAVSGEIVLENLIKTLMVIALEHAGAERGLLVLPRGGQLWVEAEATTGLNTVEVILRQALVASSELPDSVLQYVIRTQEPVILGDASKEELFSADNYIIQKHARSLLCLPLVKQAELIGVLYLENNLASHVFTPARIAVLKLLSSQAAISLQNARLYAELINENRDRQKAEEALRNSQADLARVARLTTMGELAASLAHEINQPLAAIVTNGDAALRWLNRDNPDLGEARHALSSIVRDGARAGGVIRGLRALAKKSEPERAMFDINVAIEEVLTLTRSELQRHGVALHTDLSADDRPVFGDRVQLQQVLLNLIMNGIEAMKAVAAQTRELGVSSALTEQGSVLVAVEDTGTGLDPAIEQRIFEPFFTTKSDGLGMGLSICRSIIEAHGGRLWVSPRAPHGTVLRFTVPMGVKI